MDGDHDNNALSNLTSLCRTPCHRQVVGPTTRRARLGPAAVVDGLMRQPIRLAQTVSAAPHRPPMGETTPETLTRPVAVSGGLTRAQAGRAPMACARSPNRP